MSGGPSDGLMASEYQAADKCLAESDEAGREAMKRWRSGAGYLQDAMARWVAGGNAHNIEKHEHRRASRDINARKKPSNGAPQNCILGACHDCDDWRATAQCVRADLAIVKQSCHICQIQIPNPTIPANMLPKHEAPRNT